MSRTRLPELSISELGGVSAEWLRRTEAEYRSAAFTQHFTLWLIQIGASPDLIDDGLRVVGDEMAHARLSWQVAQAAGAEAGPALVREELALSVRPSEPLEHAVVRVAVETYCLGETVAVRLFNELRRGCTVPVARRALDRILRDEVRHRDFGWDTLTWLLASPLGDDLRAHAQAELPAMVQRLRANYGAGGNWTVSPGQVTWGLMGPDAYRAVLDEVTIRDYQPRFAALGLTMGIGS